MIAKANISSIKYEHSGDLVCKAVGVDGVVVTDDNGVDVTKHIELTVKCRKLNYLHIFSSIFSFY